MVFFGRGWIIIVSIYHSTYLRVLFEFYITPWLWPQRRILLVCFLAIISTNALNQECVGCSRDGSKAVNHFSLLHLLLLLIALQWPIYRHICHLKWQVDMKRTKVRVIRGFQDDTEGFAFVSTGTQMFPF